MGDRAANINEKRRKTAEKVAGPTYGFSISYALWDREIRIRPGFWRLAEFEIPVSSRFAEIFVVNSLPLGSNSYWGGICMGKIWKIGLVVAAALDRLVRNKPVRR